MRYLVAWLAMLSLNTVAAWTFDWSSPVDQMGKPRGCFSVTPFPIMESSTSYSITNDEGLHTYNLGTLYFVDGAAADDTGNGLTFATPKKLITSILTVAGTSNNSTVLVRGAHDAFDGVYVGTAYGTPYGLGDTNRFHIIGYGQERPIFDGDNVVNQIFGIFSSANPSNLWLTLQRLQFRNCGREPVLTGYDGSSYNHIISRYLNVIDCHFTNNTTSTANAYNGNLYYLNADNGWVSHCTMEHSQGHGIKIGDGTSYIIVEWNMIRDNGWWNGKLPGDMDNRSRTVGIDNPADRDSATNNIFRYNLMTNCLSHGMQFRRSHAFVAHHNDISGFGRGLEITNTSGMGGVVPGGALFLSTSSGTFYANKVHDCSISNDSGVFLDVETSLTNGLLTIANNLVYGTAHTNSTGIYLGIYNADDCVVVNNTFDAGFRYSFYLRTLASANPPIFANNIFNYIGPYVIGTNQSGGNIHLNNLYYYPNGSAPLWGMGATETNLNPLFVSATDYRLQASSPAIDKGTNTSFYGVTNDINGKTRVGAYDIGAYEIGGPKFHANNARVGRIKSP